jgi:hypothetical protein
MRDGIREDGGSQLAEREQAIGPEAIGCDDQNQERAQGNDRGPYDVAAGAGKVSDGRNTAASVGFTRAQKDREVPCPSDLFALGLRHPGPQALGREGEARSIRPPIGAPAHGMGPSGSRMI